MDAHTSSHWTEHEEVLDRYVLGRIDPAALRVLDEHLESCARCREAVTRHRELVAGVRRLGRDELKAKLARRIATTSRPRVPWPHVISAAAVFVIAVGVAIYAFWSPLETWYEGSLTGALPDTARVDAPSLDVAQGQEGRSSLDDIAARNEALLEKIDRIKGEDQKIVAAPAPKAASEAVETHQEHDAAVAAGAGTSVSVWVQGVILQQAKDAAKQPAAADEFEARTRKKSEASERKTIPLRRQEGASVSQAVATELRQQTLGALPPSQQQRAQVQGKVETLVEQTGQGLRLTLYLEEAVPEAELQEAEVYAVGNDSLVVLLPTRQIAYKLPSSIGNVQATQLKAK